MAIGLMLALAFLLASCSSVQRRAESPKTVAEAVEKVESGVESEAVPLPEEFQDYNANVEKWIKYFTGRGKKQMKKYLSRSGRYVGEMKNILRYHGIPEELVYVAMIESGFSSRAVSHASAVGYWQFIRDTGRRYGLEISGQIDDRRDPILATHAAALYLKALHNVYGSWHLALASYNTGENRVKRAVMKHYTRDYWKLVEKKALPRETRNYVGKYLAALRIATNPESFGFHGIEYQEPLSFEKVEVAHAVDLRKMAKKMGLAQDKLKFYNPRYRYDLAPLRKGTVSLRVPVGMTRPAQIAASASRWKRGNAYIDGKTYIVRRGDTLSGIAQKTGTKISQLRSWNGLGRRSLIRVGQKLRVGHQVAVAANTKVESYTVRRGDTLSAIAQRTGVSVSRLRDLNGLGRRSLIRVGQKLKLRPRNTASARKLRQAEKKRSRIHIVRRGDTLIGIAKRYSISIQRLVAANGISNAARIMTGSQLVIPD